MNIRPKVYLVGVLMLGVTHAFLLAQERSLKQCLEIAGASDQKAFIAFDRELRVALSNQDPTLIAVLSAYPLRVHARGGTTSIDDARTLYARSGEVFAAAIRSKVLATKTPEIICSNSGIGYGNRALWVGVSDQGGVERYLIQSVNLPDTPNLAPSGLLFVCRTDEQRVVIDRLANGNVRFRLWNQPRTPTDPPNVELLSGKELFEGTGVCAHKVWTFKNSEGSYIASQLGCSGEPTPEDALGLLKITGPQSKHWWCD